MTWFFLNYESRDIPTKPVLKHIYNIIVKDANQDIVKKNEAVFFFFSKAFYQQCKSIGNPHRCAILRPTVKLHSNHWITLLFDTIFFEGPKWRFKFGFYYLLFFLYNGCFALQPSQYHNFQQVAIKVIIRHITLLSKDFTLGLKQIWGCSQMFVF